MKFKDALNRVKKLLTVKGKVRQYFLYAAIILAVLSLVNGYLTSRANTQLEKEKSELSRLQIQREGLISELLADRTMLANLQNDTQLRLAESGEKEAIAHVAIESLVQQLGVEKAKGDNLEGQLTAAQDHLAGAELKNSFLGERITEELYNYFPEAGHLFFSETQENLFRANPATANLIYTIITENAVRIQIIGNLTDQIEVATDLLEQTVTLAEIRGEEILAYEVLVGEYDDVFDNLEAALSLERRTTSNLERQIAIMNRKNLFEKILPSLNVVLGPYYDPFRNQGGFAIALGLGWRFKWKERKKTMSCFGSKKTGFLIILVTRFPSETVSFWERIYQQSFLEDTWLRHGKEETTWFRTAPLETGT